MHAITITCIPLAPAACTHHAYNRLSILLTGPLPLIRLLLPLPLQEEGTDYSEMGKEVSERAAGVLAGV